MIAGNTNAAAILQRIRNVVTRNFPVSAALLCFVAALTIYLPAMGSSRFIFGTDTISHDYIFHLFGWNAIHRDGQIPLWCPYIFCGLPTVGSFAFCPFYPSQLLYFVLPHNTAFTAQYALAVAVAGIGICYWMSVLGLGRAAAIWAAFAFMFSGHFLTLTHAGHLQKMMAVAWAPTVLAGSHQLLRGMRPVRAVFITATALAMQLLASHTQIFYATAGIALLLIVSGTVATPEVRRAVSLIAGGRSGFAPLARPVTASLGGFAGAVLLALIFSAPQILPGLEMNSVSNRADGVSFSEAVETSYPPEDLLEFVVPRAFGDSVRGSRTGYFGRWGSERIVSDFIGVPMLVLAGIGLLLARRRMRWFLAGVVILSLLIGLGKYTPLYSIMYAVAPGFDSFRSPGTFMFLATMGLVALAAFGFDALAERAPHLSEEIPSTALQRLFKLPRARLIALITLLAFGLILIVYGISRNWQVKLDIATPDELRRFHLNRNFWLLGIELVATVAILAACLARIRWAVPTLAAFAVALCAMHNLYFIRYDPLAPYRSYLRSQPIYAAMTNLKLNPARMLEERDLKTDNILHDVASPTGYHPILFSRYERLMQTLGYRSDDFCDLLAINAAHTYSPQPPDGNWTAASQFGRPTQMLWQRRPAASYIKNRVLVVEMRSEKEVAAAMSTDEFDPARIVLIDAKAKTAAGIPDSLSPVVGELSEWTPERVSMLVHSAGAGLLPVAEVFAPGWRAESDGTRLKVVPVNIAQRCILWEGGSGSVKMEYDPFSFRLGMFLFLLSLSAGVTAAAAKAFVGLRRFS